MGVAQVYERFFKEFESTILPKWLIVSTAYYTSYVELIGGFLLIIGLFRKQAIYLLALDLLIVSFGHGFMEPIWDLSHVIPRAVLTFRPCSCYRRNGMFGILDALIKKTVK